MSVSSSADSSEGLNQSQSTSPGELTGETASPTRSRLPVLIYVVELIFLLVGASVLAARDDRLDRTALSFLTPVVTALEPFGAELVRNAHTIVPAAGLSLAAVLGTLFIGSLAARGNQSGAMILAGAAAVTAGEIALIESWAPRGVILLGVSVGVAALLWPSQSQSKVPPGVTVVHRANFRFSWGELFSLSAMTSIALVFRFYALNRVFNNFEGELSPYSAGATSLRGMLHANVGEAGPWAPLGYLYYVPIFVTSKLFGTTVLAIRLASAIVSTLTVPLVYGLLRRLSGRRAAILGALFLALDPLQIGWGRSDIHPHGSTVWIAILLVWACVNAAECGRHLDFIAVALLMGLACHQYPSGQVAVLIPPMFFLWNCLWRSEPDHLVSVRGAIAVLAGLALWTLGFPLEYFLAYGRWQFPDVLARMSGRTSWGAVGGGDSSLLPFLTVGGRVLSNARDLLWGVFARVPYLFHQEWIPEFPDLPPRTVFWIAAAMAWLGTLGLLRQPRDKRAAILLSWTLCGALPAVLSAQAYPKRGSITFPAIYALAAMTLASVRKRIATTRARSVVIFAVEGWAATLLVAASLQQWFSGAHFPYGEPTEVAVARKIQRLLKPGTIVVADFSDDYQRGKLTYLLLDSLESDRTRPVAWYVLDEAILPLGSVLDDPRRAVQVLGRTHWYIWTDLWYQIPEANTKWSKVLFLFQTHPSDPASAVVERGRQLVLERCPGAREGTLDESDPSSRFRAIDCDLASLRASEVSAGRGP